MKMEGNKDNLQKMVEDISEEPVILDYASQGNKRNLKKWLIYGAIVAGALSSGYVLYQLYGLRDLDGIYIPF